MCYVLHHCRSLQLCAARAFKYIGRQYFMFLKERCVRDIWIYFGSRIGIRSCGHVHVMCQVVSVPTKFGAVIRRADGMLFQRTTAENRRHDWLPNDNAFSVDEAEATRGGFTVLFDGVDE